MKLIFLLFLFSIATGSRIGVGSLGSLKFKALLKNFSKKGVAPENANQKVASTQTENRPASPENNREPVPVKLRSGSGECKGFGWFKYINYSNQLGETKNIKGFIKNSLFKSSFPDVAELLKLSRESSDNNMKNDYERQAKKLLIEKNIAARKEDDITDQTVFHVIPDSNSFFISLCKNELDIFQERYNIGSLQSFINIQDINPIPENDITSGGITSQNTKLAEGYCIKIKSKVSMKKKKDMKEGENATEKEMIWVLCTDSDSSQKSLAKELINAKIQDQRSKGQDVSISKIGDSKQISEVIPNLTHQNIDDDNVETDIKSLMKPSERDKHSCKLTIKNQNGDQTIVNGILKMIKDFGECSLDCGGGEKIRQFTCCAQIDFNKTNELANQCSGSYLHKKKCNELPCSAEFSNPNRKRNETNDKKGSNIEKNEDEVVTVKTAPPIVKVMRISNFPLRYDKCHMKEGDSLMTIVRKGKSIIEPARIVMNEYTISAYKDEVSY